MAISNCTLVSAGCESSPGMDCSRALGPRLYHTLGRSPRVGSSRLCRMIFAYCAVVYGSIGRLALGVREYVKGPRFWGRLRFRAKVHPVFGGHGEAA